jgi:hypothetical protein
LDIKRNWLVNRIRDDFFSESFFNSYSLINSITSGELKDIAPYKKLNFFDAEKKYEARKYFQESTPVKVYENGFRWIDVGRGSTLLAEMMNNCGSAGLMSTDKDATIITLFGPNGKPHVMVTYSPNEKRIGGDECAGSTAVKSEYHSYVIDLANYLGVRFDAMKSKSWELGLKYRLRDKAQFIEPIKTSDHLSNSYFRFATDGKIFYTDGYAVVSEEEVNRAKKMMDSGELKVNYSQEDAFKIVLSHNNRDYLINHGIKITSIYDFIGGG